MVRGLVVLLIVGVIGTLAIIGLVWLVGAIAHTIINLFLDGWNNSF